jgi:hypothetical protein
MANAYIDVAKNAAIDSIRTTATSGGTITNAIRVAWDDTLTREEVTNTLQNIIAAIQNPNKVAEVA